MAGRPDDRSTTSETLMVVFAMAPVAGAMLSGPIAGGTLLSLAFLDSLGLLFWVANGW